MPRSEEANRLIREQRRFSILQVAARVFSRRGFGDTRMADIAAAGEMSQGLVYRYFASKDELFAGVVGAVTEASEALARQATAMSGCAWERLRWLTGEYLLRQYQIPEFSLTVIHTHSNEAIPAEIREMVLQRSQVAIDIVRQLIEEAQADGQAAAGDPVQLTLLFFALMQGLAVGAALMPKPEAGYPDVETVLRGLAR